MRSSRAYDADLEVLPPDWPGDVVDVAPDTDAFEEALELCREVWDDFAAPARRTRERLKPLENRVRLVWSRCVKPARIVNDWYRLQIGPHRGFDPRRQPHVHRNVGCDPQAVVELIESAPIALGGGGHGPTLSIEPQFAERPDFECAHRAAARLHIPWSYPDLPMSLGVIEWSSDRCVLDLTLRSRRRIRYPLRYYHACHRVLADLAARFETSARRSAERGCPRATSD